MRQVCCVCKILYGIKPPLDDDSETHGLCPECLELELKKIQVYQVQLDKELDLLKK